MSDVVYVVSACDRNHNYSETWRRIRVYADFDEAQKFVVECGNFEADHPIPPIKINASKEEFDVSCDNQTASVNFRKLHHPCRDEFPDYSGYEIVSLRVESVKLYRKPT